jgi:hypothetical protein
MAWEELAEALNQMMTSGARGFVTIKPRTYIDSFGDDHMTPQDLLDRLVSLFPNFRVYWDAPGNCFRNDDGCFTLHGVFAEFTGFFKERHAALPLDRVSALGAFVSDCMASADDGPLDNAAATCFVENIAGEPCDRE